MVEVYFESTFSVNGFTGVYIVDYNHAPISKTISYTNQDSGCQQKPYASLRPSVGEQIGSKGHFSQRGGGNRQ
jgi:hypothetical protein